MARRLAMASVALSIASSPVASAEEPIVTPIVVRNVGECPVRVYVSVGNTLPCDSTENERILDTTLAVGAEAKTTTTSDCICTQHSQSPFVEIGWSEGTRRCRPIVCTGSGRTRRCRPAPDPTIRIDVNAAEDASGR
ncbi:MAG: hypothetical protein ACHREM_03055 [Polyangiales bacterium]